MHECKPKKIFNVHFLKLSVPKPSLTGRCYYDKNNKTRCIGYVTDILIPILNILNLTLINKPAKSCGVPSVNGSRVALIAAGVK